MSYIKKSLILALATLNFAAFGMGERSLNLPFLRPGETTAGSAVYEQLQAQRAEASERLFALADRTAGTVNGTAQILKRAQEAIDKGADINYKRLETTPLLKAIFSNNIPMVIFLLEHGAEIGNAKIYSQEPGKEEIHQMILEAEAERAAATGA